MNRYRNRLIATWLLICCLLVLSMILLGGVTRLTQSGLSMVEWDPIMGVVPPTSDAEWMAAFEQYQAYPEYRILNKHMPLAGFKRIFYVEYAHRMLGRTIGFAFLLPFLYFLLSGWLGKRLLVKLLIPFVLGGLQGLMGWYMVRSGLADVPHVSPYRLTAHLMLALLILGYMLWLAFDLLSPRREPVGSRASGGLKLGAAVMLAAIVIMIFTGGFVAGTKAGFVFNTFPKMHDRWVPEGLWVLQPAWRNLFENVATVQFIHRCMALVVTALVTGFWMTFRRSAVGHARLMANLLILILAIQLSLGISTVLYAVPITLAVAHQGGALVLFSVALLINHRIKAASDLAQRA